MATRKTKEQTPEEKKWIEVREKGFNDGYELGKSESEDEVSERMLVGFIFACQERGYSDEQTLDFWNRMTELVEQHATSHNVSVEIIRAFHDRVRAIREKDGK